MVFKVQVCQIWARAIQKHMLFILHTVPIFFYIQGMARPLKNEDKEEAEEKRAWEAGEETYRKQAREAGREVKNKGK